VLISNFSSPLPHCHNFVNNNIEHTQKSTTPILTHLHKKSVFLIQHLKAGGLIYNQTYLITYSLTLWLSDSLGLLNDRCPFFPNDCLLLPSRNLHLPQFLFHISQPPQSRSSASLTSLSLTLKYFLNCPSLIHSYCMSSPIQSLLFNICFCA
jgi:hypothetical protein